MFNALNFSVDMTGNSDTGRGNDRSAGFTAWVIGPPFVALPVGPGQRQRVPPAGQRARRHGEPVGAIPARPAADQSGHGAGPHDGPGLELHGQLRRQLRRGAPGGHRPPLGDPGRCRPAPRPAAHRSQRLLGHDEQLADRSGASSTTRRGRSPSIAGVTDGTSNTILAGESLPDPGGGHGFLVEERGHRGDDRADQLELQLIPRRRSEPARATGRIRPSGAAGRWRPRASRASIPGGPTSCSPTAR